MNSTSYDFHIAVIVRSDKTQGDDSISISELTESEELSNGVLKRTRTNLLVYKQVYKNCSSIDGAIKRFYDDWPNIQTVIEENGYKNEVFLRMFIKSAHIQTGYMFSPLSLSLLSKMNVPIEVSILPWHELQR